MASFTLASRARARETGGGVTLPRFVLVAAMAMFLPDMLLDVIVWTAPLVGGRMALNIAFGLCMFTGGLIALSGDDQ